jgi:HAD superfamily hydrolase (TIGR01509 family)
MPSHAAQRQNVLPPEISAAESACYICVALVERISSSGVFMNKFDCVIFDCDGTLVDSERLCCVLLARKLGEYGLRLDPEQLVRSYRGWPLAETLLDLSRQHGVRFDSELTKQYRAMELEAFETELAPIKGVEAALSRIALPRCVASSGPLAKIERALRVTRLGGFFGGNIFSAHQVNAWKPEPDLFLFAATRMGVSPARCAVIEDSVVGVTAARRAGMTPLFFDPDRTPLPYDDVQSFVDMDDLPAIIAGATWSSSPPGDLEEGRNL